METSGGDVDPWCQVWGPGPLEKLHHPPRLNHSHPQCQQYEGRGCEKWGLGRGQKQQPRLRPGCLPKRPQPHFLHSSLQPSPATLPCVSGTEGVDSCVATGSQVSAPTGAPAAFPPTLSHPFSSESALPGQGRVSLVSVEQHWLSHSQREPMALG